MRMKTLLTTMMILASVSLLLSCEPDDTTPPFTSPVDELLELDRFVVDMEQADTTEQWRIACEDTCIWEVTDDAGNIHLYTDTMTYYYDAALDTWSEATRTNPYLGYFDFDEDVFVYDAEQTAYVAYDITMGDVFQQVALRRNDQDQIVDERTPGSGAVMTLTYDTTTTFELSIPLVCDEGFEVVAETCVYAYEPFFDFVADAAIGSDLDTTLDQLAAFIEPYDYSRFYSVFEYFETQYIDIGDVTAEEEEQHYLYPEDVMDEPIFDLLYAPETILYYDLLYVIEVLDEPTLTLGIPNHYTATYREQDCCERWGPSMSERSADVTVLAYQADGQLYADIWRYDDDERLVERRVMYITYDTVGIVSVQSFQFEAAVIIGSGNNVYRYIDYQRDETGMALRITDDRHGIEAMNLTYFGSDAQVLNFQYDMDNDFVGMVVSDPVEEYFFWSHHGDNLDYRNLYLYQDGVFQVGHRRYLETDTDTYLGLNNFIVYNMGAVQGWDYYFDGSFYADDGTLLTSYYNGFGPNIYPFRPYLTSTIRFEIDDAISQVYYENPWFAYEYDQIPYDDFMAIWNQYDNVWSLLALSEDTFQYGTLVIDLSSGGASYIALQDDSFLRFLDDIDAVCDTCDSH